jgi:ribosome-binding factor A
MKKKSMRTNRAEGLIRRRLSEIIQREIGDPRLGMVTITHVDLAADLSIARIYITTLDENPDSIKQSLLVLNHANKFIRSMLAQAIELRKMPELRFMYDESIQHAEHMADIIRKLPDVSEDDENNQQ